MHSSHTLVGAAEQRTAAVELGRTVFEILDRHVPDHEITEVAVHFDPWSGDDDGRAEDGHPVVAIHLFNADLTRIHRYHDPTEGDAHPAARSIRASIDEARDATALTGVFDTLEQEELAQAHWTVGRPVGATLMAFVEIEELGKASPEADISAWAERLDPGDVEALIEDQWMPSALLDEAAEDHPDLARFVQIASDLDEPYAVRVERPDAWEQAWDARRHGPEIEAADLALGPIIDALMAQLWPAIDQDVTRVWVRPIDPAASRSVSDLAIVNTGDGWQLALTGYTDTLDAYTPGEGERERVLGLLAAHSKNVPDDLSRQVVRNLGWSATRPARDSGTLPAGRRKHLIRLLVGLLGVSKRQAANWVDLPDNRPDTVTRLIDDGHVPWPVGDQPVTVQLREGEAVRASDGTVIARGPSTVTFPGDGQDPTTT